MIDSYNLGDKRSGLLVVWSREKYNIFYSETIKKPKKNPLV